MLNEYFAIDIDNQGRLCSFPVLISGYIPNWEYLPDFFDGLLNQADLDWNNEKPCLEGISRCLAHFYAPKMDFFEENDGETMMRDPWSPTEEYQSLIAQVILPAWKHRDWYVSEKLAKEDVVRVLTTLPDLYRIFERC